MGIVQKKREDRREGRECLRRRDKMGIVEKAENGNCREEGRECELYSVEKKGENVNCREEGK